MIDGMMPYATGAGGKMWMNFRFSQPTVSAQQHSRRFSHEPEFPHTFPVLTDPFTGQRDGILQRCLASKTCPKFFNIDSGNEYWNKTSSLNHTDAMGNDLNIEKLAPNVRVYSITSIIFTDVTDPVATGLVDSLARPGGNLTGLTSVEGVLAGKRLEFLKETVPKLLRVAVLWDPQNPSSTQEWKENQIAARHLGLQLHSMAVRSADKYESAFNEAMKARNAALAACSTPAGGFESRADCRSGGKKSAAGDLCSGQFR